MHQKPLFTRIRVRTSRSSVVPNNFLKNLTRQLTLSAELEGGALRSQYLQEAIAEQRLTDCLEHIESLGFFGEEAQLFCLNLAQHLQEATQ